MARSQNISHFARRTVTVTHLFPKAPRPTDKMLTSKQKQIDHQVLHGHQICICIRKHNRVYLVWYHGRSNFNPMEKFVNINNINEI